MTPTETEPFDADTAAAGPEPGRLGAVDAFVAVGLIASIALGSTHFPILDVGTETESHPAVLLARRASVFAPLVLGLLAGSKIAPRMIQAPLGAFTAYLIWTISSAARTEFPVEELDRTVWFAGFTLLVVVAIERLGWRSFLLATALAGLGTVGVGFLAHAAGWVDADEVPFFEAGLFDTPRARGLMAEANIFGRSAAMLSFSGVLLVALGRSRAFAGVGAVSVLVGSTALVASQSRFALLSVVIGLSIFVARTWRWAHVVVVAGALVALAVVVFSLDSSDLQPVTRSGDDAELTTLLGRTEVWEESLELGFDNPIAGVGIEGVSAHFDALNRAGYLSWTPGHSHNLVLQAFAAHGIIGAALIVASVVVGLRYAFAVGPPGSAELVAMFAVQGIGEAILIGNPAIAPALFIGALAATSVGSRRRATAVPATR